MAEAQILALRSYHQGAPKPHRSCSNPVGTCASISSREPPGSRRNSPTTALPPRNAHPEDNADKGDRAIHGEVIGIGWKTDPDVASEFARDSPLQGTASELLVPRAMQERPKAIIAGFGWKPPLLDYRRRLSAEITESGSKRGSDPKPYRARNREFEAISLQR